MIKKEADILNLIKSDEWMMDILRAAQSLNLPDWWVCAGFVRSRIWDALHGFSERTRLPDVDLIYFDDSNLDESVEKGFEEKLKSIMPDVPWSVKNEARMHLVNNSTPYTSSVDAISKFPETVTALGVKLDGNGQLILTAPCGIEDVLNMEVRPTTYCLSSESRMNLYKQRLLKKDWKTTWERVKVYGD